MMPVAPAPASSTPVELHVRPAPEGWTHLLRGGPLSDSAQTFRAELGLARDRPIVMTGHQVEIWHPGILAKFLALDAFSRKTDVQPVWLFVDQDHNDPWSLRFPVVRETSLAEPANNALSVRTWRMDGAHGPTKASADVPVCRRPTVPAPAKLALDPGESFAAPSVGAGIERVRYALGEHAAAPNGAAQIALALADLASPLLHRPGVPIFASAIARTSLFSEIVERMRQDPAACVLAYNRAATRHPRARIAQLATRCDAGVSPSDPELPLWRIPKGLGSTRSRVCASMLSKIPKDELAPRALLMTGLLRWAGADLFVHGLGGGGASDADEHGYDRVTEEWMREWLGITLAPIAVVSATMRLRFAQPPISPTSIARAQWTAHRAAHDPALLGDPVSAERKRDFVRQIEAAKGSGGDALGAYREMHALLESSRRTNSETLGALRAAADSAASRFADAKIMADRTWAFPLYEPSQLQELRSAIDDLFKTV